MRSRRNIMYNTGCRIPVVRMLWEHDDWVRFPAARLNEAKEDSWESKGAPVELPGFLRSGRMSEHKGFPAARLNEAKEDSWESKGAPVELPGFLRSGRMSEQKGFPAARPIKT